MSADDCKLLQHRIDIWEYSLATIPENAFSLLNEEERNRSQRFLFPRHQRRFAVARAMMRAILARYLDEQAQHLSFESKEHGKPWIHHERQIEFNLSHSGDRALLAVGKTFPLGVDLEYFSARSYDDIGKHLFSPAEIACLAQQPCEQKPLVFFHIWAQKEAVIKATGLGLSYPTAQFTVPAMPPADAEIFDALHGKLWKIKSFMPQVACAAALCHDPEVTIIRKIEVDPVIFLLP